MTGTGFLRLPGRLRRIRGAAAVLALALAGCVATRDAAVRANGKLALLHGGR